MPLALHGGTDSTTLGSDAEDDQDDPQVPDASSITRTYHFKLNGKSIFFWVGTNANMTYRADLW